MPTISKTAMPGQTKPIAASNKETQLVNFLKKNCSEFLSIALPTKHLLFRGYENKKDIDGAAFIGHPRTNRRPMDSDLDVHNYVNFVLSSAGLPTRGNSLFCTSNIDEAIGYAGSLSRTYMIFPLNGFSYLWNTMTEDLVLSDNVEFNLPKWYLFYDPTIIIKTVNYYLKICAKERIVCIETGNDDAEYQIDSAEDYLSQVSILLKQATNTKYHHSYTLDDVYDTIENLNSAYEFLHKYSKVNPNFADLKPLLVLIKNIQNYKPVLSKANAISIANKMHFKNTNLTKALLNKHEVSIYGNYIALRYTKYYRLITKEFPQLKDSD